MVTTRARGLSSDGAPTPLGATWFPAEEAWNFALYSRHATGVTLLLYREDDPVRPVLELALDPVRHKTSRIWHCVVPAANAPGAALYAYRVTGPRSLDDGHRFDPEKMLLDPYARAVRFPPAYSRNACSGPGPTDGRAPLGVLPRGEPPYDWSHDPRPRHAHDAIIYELHVKGFTARSNSGVSADRRGTFAGLIEKIPYLKELGVTIVELLPIHQFDPQEGNYWGYMTLNFMAPHHSYAAGTDAAREFGDLVRALHEAGIEIVLDVVYNHTSELDEHGPTYSFRGIDNRSYYLLGRDLRTYANDTGCGNTTRCANPATRALVLTSLQRWARDFHVDGFRFDLASIFTRNSNGTINTTDPPLVAEIGFMASSLGLRLVAEAWDVTTYQLGRGFPGLLWMQWNGRYRDDLRSFVKGDPGLVGALMCRLYGSDDLFPGTVTDACRPQQSVNFVTAHDGFCLYDLVSFHDKRNWANGHDNADGANDNRSWNCGWEGDEGAPPDVLALRARQVKNFFCLLMLSNGVPMFSAGDEFMQTQGGNNNPYNQDNETTWLDWDLLARNRDVFRFFQRMIAFRKAHPSIGRGRFWRDDVTWYGVAGAPDLSPDSRTLAYCLRGASERDADLYVMINAYWEPLRFRIEATGPTAWRRVIDTSLPAPTDILDPGAEIAVDAALYDVGPRSVVVLVARPGDA